MTEIAVLGAGIMGHGIALVFGLGGHKVRLTDSRPETLAKAAAGIRDVDTVIPGHRQIATWNEFKEYALFTKDFVDFARSSLNAKKTAQQTAADYKIPAKYSGYVVTIDPQLVTAAGLFQIVFDELKK